MPYMASFLLLFPLFFREISDPLHGQVKLGIYLATRKSTQLTARYASSMKSQTPGEKGSRKEKYPGLLP